MRRIILAFVAATVMCSAADLTGNWSGTLALNNGDQPGYLVLTQKEHQVTGTAGADASKQVPLVKGIVDGPNVILEAKPGPATLRFALRVSDDRQNLRGDVYENDDKIGTASFRRVLK